MKKHLLPFPAPPALSQWWMPKGSISSTVHLAGLSNCFCVHQVWTTAFALAWDRRDIHSLNKKICVSYSIINVTKVCIYFLEMRWRWSHWTNWKLSLVVTDRRQIHLMNGIFTESSNSTEAILCSFAPWVQVRTIVFCINRYWNQKPC